MAAAVVVVGVGSDCGGFVGCGGLSDCEGLTEEPFLVGSASLAVAMKEEEIEAKCQDGGEELGLRFCKERKKKGFIGKQIVQGQGPSVFGNLAQPVLP